MSTRTSTPNWHISRINYIFQYKYYDYLTDNRLILLLVIKES